MSSVFRKSNQVWNYFVGTNFAIKRGQKVRNVFTATSICALFCKIFVMYLLAFNMPHVHRKWWGLVSGKDLSKLLCLHRTLHTHLRRRKGATWSERNALQLWEWCVAIVRGWFFYIWALFYLQLDAVLNFALHGNHIGSFKSKLFFFVNLQILKRVAHQYFCFQGFDTLVLLLWIYFSWMRACSWSMWEWGSWSCHLQLVRYNRSQAGRRQLVK